MTQEKKQRRSIEQRLGAALFDAVGLLVRQYFDGGEDENESVEALGTERNESFDENRFFSLEREQSGETAEEFRRGEESLFHANAGENELLSVASRGHERASAFPRAAEQAGEAGMSARLLSEQFERDARRYDGGFDF